jgi:hypothetical protein
MYPELKSKWDPGYWNCCHSKLSCSHCPGKLGLCPVTPMDLIEITQLITRYRNTFNSIGLKWQQKSTLLLQIWHHSWWGSPLCGRAHKWNSLMPKVTWMRLKTDKTWYSEQNTGVCAPPYWYEYSTDTKPSNIMLGYSLYSMMLPVR